VPDLKKKPIFIFLIALAIIVILMIIANVNSDIVLEFDVLGGGVKELYTIDNLLVSVSPENQISVWDWNNLRAKPHKIIFSASDAILLPAGKVVWIPLENSDKIIVSDSTINKELQHFTLDFGWEYRRMVISRNGRFVAAAFEKKAADFSGSNSYKNIRIAMLSEDFNNLTTVVDLSDIILKNLAISDNGELIAVVGLKNDVSWAAIINVKNEEVVWQRNINEVTEPTKIIFSPGNDMIYTAGIGRIVYGFKVDNGNLVCQFQMDENTIAQKRQLISAIAISNNGYFLGASTEPSGMVYIWNPLTGKRIYTGSSGMIVTNNFVFSPDSKLFAVSALQKQPIRVFKCP
jgi:WD40 repeat protein